MSLYRLTVTSNNSWPEPSKARPRFKRQNALRCSEIPPEKRSPGGRTDRGSIGFGTARVPASLARDLGLQSCPIVNRSRSSLRPSGSLGRNGECSAPTAYRAPGPRGLCQAKRSSHFSSALTGSSDRRSPEPYCGREIRPQPNFSNE